MVRSWRLFTDTGPSSSSFPDGTSSVPPCTEQISRVDEEPKSVNDGPPFHQDQNGLKTEKKEEKFLFCDVSVLSCINIGGLIYHHSLKNTSDFHHVLVNPFLTSVSYVRSTILFERTTFPTTLYNGSLLRSRHTSKNSPTDIVCLVQSLTSVLT